MNVGSLSLIVSIHYIDNSYLEDQSYVNWLLEKKDETNPI